jgi:serine/threonine-protein kinase
MKSKKYYQVVRNIGRGGHGYVNEVVNHDGVHLAMKKLTHIREGKGYSRFKSEIDILLQLNGLPGIIEIVDHHFPEKFSKEDRPYYVMPLGEPFTEFIKNKLHQELFPLFLKICRAVEELHAKDITHRDIKPANLLMVGGEPALSDFGLANFPLKPKVSEPDEAIGAKWTIAPEMERVSSTAAFKKADVYSLAKTLWILVTGNTKGFEGQYIPHSSISLNKYVALNVNKGFVAGTWHYFSIVLLEQLLVDSTSNDADQRPSITDFIRRLAYWFRTNTEYFERNLYEWEDALKRIFPTGIPSHCEWKSTKIILTVLKILTEYDNLNHSFLPPHGGLDIKEVRAAEERDCLIFDGEIFKPETLYFEYLGDPEWSYFRIDFADLAPLTHGPDDGREDLFMSETGEYSTNREPGNFAVTRYLNGSLVVSAKMSRINQITGPMDGYSGIHNKMTATEYRQAWQYVKDQRERELMLLIGNRNAITF